MITDLLVILTGLIGFIILFILCGSRTNRIVNINMALIIFGASLRLLLIGIASIYKNSYLENLNNQLNTIFILFVPVFYLYFKNLIQNKNYFTYKDLYHFIFPLLVILENKLSLFDNIFDIKFNHSFVYIFIVYALLYNIATFFQLRKHVWFKKATLEIAIKQNQLIRNWSIYFYCTMNLMIIRVFVSIYIEMKSNQIINAQYGLWASSIVWLVVFAKILTTPEILYGYSYLAKKGRELNTISKNLSNWNLNSKNKINNIQDQQLKEKIDANIEKYINEIDTIILQDNYFRNPEFSMKEFAIVLNIPKSHLKYLFKYHSKVSFSDFKKITRIQDAILLIDQKFLSTNTLESLSKEVGFTSYNPFFTSFKDVVGKSPQEYITTLN
jgi:AraC-like DNA-binding protein